MRGGVKLPEVQRDVVILKGGMDQITPTLDLDPGFCKSAVNFEALATGGYGRINGYERYDGRAAAPSVASYQAISVASFTNLPTVSQTLTGQTSGATGVIIYIGTNWLAVTKVTGSFQTGEVVKVGATVTGTTTASGASISSALNATLLASAADQYRSAIGVVPGSGPVRGVWLYNDTLYAFRDNAGATACLMYKATTSGWTQIALGSYITFTAGTGAGISDGAIVTGATSGATGTVTRSAVQSGAWGSNAAGILTFASITGTFQNGEALKVGGVAMATCGGAQTAITLANGGKFEFCNANFYGGLSTYRMYGCDGVNHAFEFDGTVFVPIFTGFSPDQPKHIEAHKGYLFISVQTSIGFSAPGLPYNWTALAGAGSIATGDTVTGLLVMPGAQTTATLAVFGAQNTFMLYGTGSSSWNFVTYNTGAGALDYTAQNMDDAYCLDYRGVVSFKATLNYGNFDTASLTNRVRTFILNELTNASYACINRGKSQYRLFFSDGYGLYVTLVDGNNLGCMPVFFPNPVYSLVQGRKSNGTEVTFFGSTNGYVYQLDSGTGFDGVAINASITLAWNFSKSPRVLKRYRKAAVEVSGPGYCSLGFGYSLQFGNSAYAQPGGTTNYPSSFSSQNWDSFTWDAFTWDGQTLMPSECELQGTGENIAVTLSSTSNAYAAFTINSVILHYTPRRALR